MNTKKWYPGFEWLRVIYTMFVVAMHTNACTILSKSATRFTIYDLLSFNLLCTAVPGFLIISSFILAKKRLQNWSDCRRHLSDLLYLYAFWVGLWMLLTRMRPEKSLLGVIEFFMRGGGWAYYFFFVLILIHLIVLSFRNSKNSILWLCLGITSAAIFTCFCAMSWNEYAWTRITTYWWPIAFLPTAFIGILVARYEDQLRISSALTLRWLAVGIISLVLLCLLEWRLAPASVSGEFRNFLPEYLRLSPILTATIFMVCSLFLGKCHSIVRFLSRNSLGIFCLHVFFIGGIGKLLAGFIHDPLWASIGCVIVTMIVASILSELLRFIMKSRLI